MAALAAYGVRAWLPGLRKARLEGDLTLHGVTHPLTVHSNATLQANRLTARGTFVIKQTDFGIRPVTAGGGTVKVKNEVEVEVEFVLEARRSVEAPVSTP